MANDRSILERQMERVELRPFTLDGFHRRPGPGLPVGFRNQARRSALQPVRGHVDLLRAPL